MLPPVLEQSTAPIAPAKVNGNCLSAGGAIRLNLGGIGDKEKAYKIPGFLIVDLQDIPATDVVCDISKLEPFKDESVDEIYCSNALEHFPHTQTVDVLREWYRVLKKGSKLWISVPDMDANFRLFQKHGMIKWVINLIYGDQIHHYAYHYINFTFGSLAAVVMEAGFSDIKRVAKMPFGLPDASAHRDNIDFQLISLNVQVTK